MSKATAAKAAIEERKGNDELRATLAELGDDIALNAKTDEDGKRQTASGFHLPDKGKSLGEQFTDSPEYKALLGQAKGGQFGAKQRIQSEMVGFKSLVTGGSDTSAGAPDQRLPRPAGRHRRLPAAPAPAGRRHPGHHHATPSSTSASPR
jgi:hypothetical protein